MSELNMKRAERIIRYALKEDVWTGDITTESVLDRPLKVDAVVLSCNNALIG